MATVADFIDRAVVGQGRRRRPGEDRGGSGGVLQEVPDAALIWESRSDSSRGCIAVSAEPIENLCAYPALPAPVKVPLANLPAHACPYLPNRNAEDRAIWASEIPAELYEQFMNAGFRRSGRLIYQPACRGCRECKSIRVPVAKFRPDKSQRRCAKAQCRSARSAWSTEVNFREMCRFTRSIWRCATLTRKSSALMHWNPFFMTRR